MNSFEALANAVIERAARDYREALHYLKENPRTPEMKDSEVLRKNPGLERARNRIIDAEVTAYGCEKFFKSGYFEILTDLDGPALMRGIRKLEGV